MNNVQDIAVDADNHLVISFPGGDFVISLSTERHIKHILQSDQGWWKARPVLGAGLIHFMNMSFNLDSKNAMTRVVKLQCEFDGMTVNKITAKSFENISIDANF